MSFVSCLKKEAAQKTTTFNKALGIVRDGRVMSCDASEGQIEGVVHLCGRVRGSGGTTYLTKVSLDLFEDAVIDYSCTCPAAASYYGMCKHACALSLKYLNGEGYVALGGAGSAPLSSAPLSSASSKPSLPSSPQISNMLSAFANEQMAQVASAAHERQLVRAAYPDPADFAVEVALANPYSSSWALGSTWLLRLRVCRGKASYVVKNMSSLVRSYEKGEEVTYGKNLTLRHVPSAFTQRARELLALVTRIVHTHEAMSYSGSHYWGTSLTKELPVSERDLAEVLALMEGTTIEYAASFGPYYSARPRTLLVRAGNPVLEARLSAAKGGGYDLVLPGGLTCVRGADAMYVLDDRCAWRCDEHYACKMGVLLKSVCPVMQPMHIGEQDIEGFCATVLPILREQVRLEAPEELFGLVPPAAAITFKIGLYAGAVTCSATVAYGERTIDLFDPPGQGQPVRDVALEYAAQDAVLAYFPEEGHLPWFDEHDAERMYLLLTDGLKELAELGEVLLSERLRGIAVRESPSVRVKASVRSGLLDLAVDSSNMSAGELAEYLASYRRKQRFARLSNGDIVRLDGSVRALADLADGLGVDDVDMVRGVAQVPANRTLYVDALLKKAEGVRFEKNAAFRSIIRDFDSIADADFCVPEQLEGVMRPYQEEGFRWLCTLDRFGFGGILADDMGLGKTLQVIAYLSARKQAGEAKPSLVVCPASLVYNWMSELARFAPQLDALAVLGSKGQRTCLIGSHAEHDVLVTSYDLMKRDVEAYQSAGFHAVVLDEAQYIKNAGTQAAKCAKCLPCEVRFALTGTPIENRLAELWSIFDFLMPGILGSHDAFAKRFEGPVENREQGAAERLQCMVRPFVLRRLKGDVLRDLPEKCESVVYAQMSGEQEKLYKANQDRLAMQVAREQPREFAQNKLQVLAELTKLRQICCDPHLFYENYDGQSAKLETCMELVRSAVDAGHGILLFSQFTSMLSIISERLVREKVPHFVLTGSTSKEERTRLVECFQDGEVPVFLISLKAGGVGLNLTRADVVIHYDPWWNLAVQNQATDRAHRIGQTRAVSVFKLIVKDTIEERIVQMQQSKRDLAESVLGGDGVGSASFSKEDILALLGA